MGRSNNESNNESKKGQRMAKRKKAKKVKKALAASYRTLAADLLAKLERDQPAEGRRRVAFLVHDDALVEAAASKKYVWVDAKVLVRVRRPKETRPQARPAGAPSLHTVAAGAGVATKEATA
jgi:hypothetical protein